MIGEFTELISMLKRYYGKNYVGLLVYELIEKDHIGVLVVFRERSPIMIDDSIRLMNLVKHLYPDAKSASVITLEELKERLNNPNDNIREFIGNIVFIHDESGELKRIIPGT